MSLVSEAGSKRSFSAAAASVAPLCASTRMKERAAMAGAVTGWRTWASAGMAIHARTTARIFFKGDFLSVVADRGADAERLLDLLRDGRGLRAIAIRTEPHAVHAILVR